MTVANLPGLSVAELQKLLRGREVSPREALESLRHRIAETDGEIGAYLSSDFDAAAKEADHADVSLPLGGVPIAIKDVISMIRFLCGRFEVG